MTSYAKPITMEEQKAIDHLCIFHPDLLNPEFFGGQESAYGEPEGYEKPRTAEDHEMIALLCIFHPDLLNSKYFETADEEEEE